MRELLETRVRRTSAASASSSHDLSISSDHPDKQHRCNLCSKQFSRAAILRDHIRRHEKEKPFQCGTCRKAFASKSDLKRHEDAHAGRKFTCDRCGRQFTRRLTLTKHVCVQSHARNAAYNVTQSIEDDASIHFNLPSGARPQVSENASTSPIIESHTTDSPAIRLTHTSAQLHGPFPSPPPVQLITEDYRSFSGVEDEDDDDTISNITSSESDTSSNASNCSDNEPLPDWEEFNFQCGICPAQYEHNAPFARHLLHHLEELDLRPYRCNDCKISFAFQEELAKHEKHDQQEQHEGSLLPLPCIWYCGKVFATADAYREHLDTTSDARCKLVGGLELHLRITVLRQYKELLAPEAVDLVQDIQKLIDSSLCGYKPRSLDMGWLHQMIDKLDEE